MPGSHTKIILLRKLRCEDHRPDTVELAMGKLTMGNEEIGKEEIGKEAMGKEATGKVCEAAGI